MSKILGKNETGFGVLIENDAGYVTKDLNKNLINENFEFDFNQPILINCVLQKWGVPNKNGRIYPEDILKKQAEEYQKLIDNNNAISESDHPSTSTISLHNISHVMRKIWWGKGENSNILYGQLEIITSPGFIKTGTVSMVGDKILVYLQKGIRLGISSRGVGTLKEINGQNIVQDDFELVAFDLVATPSTPGAYLFPEKNIMELGENIAKETSKNNIITENENNKLINSLDKFLLLN